MCTTVGEDVTMIEEGKIKHYKCYLPVEQTAPRTMETFKRDAKTADWLQSPVILKICGFDCLGKWSENATNNLQILTLC
jgi:4-diphosphocytidyl-2C-methyl-D-erythritol kinase